uniref:GDSL esterase/lipase EXL1-like isoform X3 n=1 Tax=Nicotiana tabacum TaxID=4097 RepID=A0A1S4AZU7_TOBAC|nr:PREDICTED: GDSL esterase/lipase EXL1-like isoform X3 [Nicotiana tabacum]
MALLYCVVILLFSACEAKLQLPQGVNIKAVFAFGDSIVDQGNNNNLTTRAKCNFLPYGKDFMGGKPTGRFSNAKTPPDMIVEELGIKELMPAYFDPNLKVEDLKTGVSFASGASGYDLLTAITADLYTLGTRKIWVFGIPPIGCLPSQRQKSGGLARVCVEEYNQAAQLANTKLAAKIDSLSEILPQSELVFINIYDPLLDLIDNPDKYGFEEVKRCCCRPGKNKFLLCNNHTKTCEDDTKYLFWDGYHLTEKGYRVLVDQIFKE